MPRKLIYREFCREGELELIINLLIFSVRIERIFDRDVDRSIQVERVNFGGVSRERRREKQFLALAEQPSG